MNKPYRPKNLEEYNVIRKKWIDPADIQRALQFQPRPSDIFITPYEKCGTTWLQQIAHTLRTRGDMDFEEISDVAPWLELAYALDYDIEGEQVAFPRLYKSHLTYDDIPKGARYIVSFRAPEKAKMSFFRFFEGWMFEAGGIMPMELFESGTFRSYAKPDSYWGHLLSWWAQRDNPDVLLLCYEDMLEDSSDAIKRIAQFMGIELDDALFEIVRHHSSREFMLKHVEKFSENRFKALTIKKGNLPDDGDAAKVTTGNANHDRYRITDAMQAKFHAIWHEMITDTLGFEDYAAFRKALRQHHH